MSGKLVILFPGIKYSVDCPLLYYPKKKYEAAGYEILPIENYEVTDEECSFEDYIKTAVVNVEKRFENFDFSVYKEIVFVSKSMGTVVALSLEDRYEIPNVTHVLLTPIRGTFPLLTKERNIDLMVSGTEDPLVDLPALTEISQENQLPLTVVEGANHSLEIAGDVERNLGIIREIVEQL